jgi:uncharacterized membrane protein
MGWFILAGGLVLGWRLMVDPGLDAYLVRAPLYEVLLAFGSALIGLGLARIALPDAPGRDWVHRLLGAGLWAYGGVLASILLFRLLDTLGLRDDTAEIALFGLMWFAVAMAQVYQARSGARLPAVSWTLAALFGIPAALAFVGVLALLNPLFGLVGSPDGPWLADTLFIAYALPGLAFLGLGLWANWLPFRPFARWGGIAFLALYGVMEIRRFWHGGDVWLGFGVTQAELYTYTLALLLLGGTLLYQAIARTSPGLRRIAMTVIAIAVAKVFLIDASGLSGLLRVFSFLGLGLVLAGLAWLNRWAALQAREERQATD